MSATAATKKGKVDIDRTREALLSLGLCHAAERLGDMLTDAVRDKLPTHRFLDQLLEEEQCRREERRIKTSLRLSGLPPGQTLAGFDWSFQPGI